MLGGGGVLGLLSVRPHFCWGGVGAAKGLLPYFLVPKGNQPTACTLALWWLKFGPTGGGSPWGPLPASPGGLRPAGTVQATTRLTVRRAHCLCRRLVGAAAAPKARDALEGASEAVRQAVGGGCRSGWGRLLSVTNAIEADTWRQGDSGWAPSRRGGEGSLLSNASPKASLPPGGGVAGPAAGPGPLGARRALRLQRAGTWNSYAHARGAAARREVQPPAPRPAPSRTRKGGVTERVTGSVE